MSSFPNEFNPYGYSSMNHNGFLPVPITRNESQTVRRSMFPTTENTNHANLFSSSPPFTSTFHHSPVLSSSLRFNDSRMGYQMASNIVSDVRRPRTPQISGFSTSQMSPLLITRQTYPNRYNHAIVPTNNVVSAQNRRARAKRVMTSDSTILNSTSFRPNFFGNQWETTYPKPIDYFVSQQGSTSGQNFVQNRHERAKRVMTSDSTILNSTSLRPNVFGNQWETTYPKSVDYFVSQQGSTSGQNFVQNRHERAKRVMTSDSTILNSTSLRPNVFGNQWETTYPKPVDYFVSQQGSTSGQNFDLSSLSPKHHGEQYGLEDGRPVKKIRTETESLDYSDYSEDETSDDSEDETSDDSEDESPTHSLPNQKCESYICPTCNSLFDTSSAARMGLVHSGRKVEARQ